MLSASSGTRTHRMLSWFRSRTNGNEQFMLSTYPQHRRGNYPIAKLNGVIAQGATFKIANLPTFKWIKVVNEVVCGVHPLPPCTFLGCQCTDPCYITGSRDLSIHRSLLHILNFPPSTDT